MNYDQPAENRVTSHYEYTTNEVIPIDVGQVKTSAFQFMDKLDGWCSHQKASILIDLILKFKPKTVLEIGVWGGRSLVPMACALKANTQGIIYGIDPWDSLASIEEAQNESNKDWWSKVDHNAVLQKLIGRIDEFKLVDQIKLLKTTSEKADPILNIDILHVDGNHSDKTSYFDVQKWVPMVNKGGFIIFDDMTWTENGINTTARAVEWLDENCIKIGEYQDNCLWGIWQKS